MHFRSITVYFCYTSKTIVYIFNSSIILEKSIENLVRSYLTADIYVVNIYAILSRLGKVMCYNKIPSQFSEFHLSVWITRGVVLLSEWFIKLYTNYPSESPKPGCSFCGFASASSRHAWHLWVIDMWQEFYIFEYFASRISTRTRSINHIEKK